MRRIGELPRPVLSRARAFGGERVSVGLARCVALRASRSAAGRLVDSPPPGFGIPLELAAIEPRTYAPLLPAGARDAVLGLDPGEALLTRTSARLRRLGRAGESGSRKAALCAWSGSSTTGSSAAPRSW